MKNNTNGKSVINASSVLLITLQDYHESRQRFRNKANKYSDDKINDNNDNNENNFDMNYDFDNNQHEYFSDVSIKLNILNYFISH